MSNLKSQAADSSFTHSMSSQQSDVHLFQPYAKPMNGECAEEHTHRFAYCSYQLSPPDIETCCCLEGAVACWGFVFSTESQPIILHFWTFRHIHACKHTHTYRHIQSPLCHRVFYWYDGIKLCFHS